MFRNKLILLSGSNGQLAKEFQSILSQKKIKFFAPDEAEFDITDFKQTERLISSLNPQIIINCAAYNAVDPAEIDEVNAFRVNAEAVGNLASLCRKQNISLVHYSSDYVFDGQKQTPYVEDDLPNPINKYGESKLRGEEEIKKQLTDFLIFRSSWVIGKGEQNFLYKLNAWAKAQPVLKISLDEVSVPTFTEDIVNVTLLALEKKLQGLYHLTNSGYCSRYALAKYFIEKSSLKNEVIPVSLSSFNLPAKRPAFSAMSNAKVSHALNIIVPAWQDAVTRYIEGMPKAIGLVNI